MYLCTLMTGKDYNGIAVERTHANGSTHSSFDSSCAWPVCPPIQLCFFHCIPRRHCHSIRDQMDVTHFVIVDRDGWIRFFFFSFVVS